MDITGYCEPLSLRAGEPITLFASSHRPGPARVELVRLICGDPTRSGPGFKEIEVPIGSDVDLGEQPIKPGSWGGVDLTGLVAESRIHAECHVLATRPGQDQTIVSVVADAGPVLEIGTRGGRFVATVGEQTLVVRSTPIAERRWYQVSVDLDLRSGQLTGSATTGESRSPARDGVEPGEEPVSLAVENLPAGNLDTLLLACGATGTADQRERVDHFDGRISRPRLQVDDTLLAWDLAQDMGGRTIVETSGNERHGVLHQLPARGITGPDWDGSVQDWQQKPEHYDAVHFHHDDLYDAQWDPTTTIDLPADLESGIYAFRVTQPGNLEGSGGNDAEQPVDRVPFFVRPAAGAPTADVALLMSSCTYMAYANHRMLFEGADFIEGRSRLRKEHAYVRDHPEVGRSHYEKHPDGSGVMYSSRRRPVLNLRPGADGWNFTPDTDINAFLDQTGVGHDVIADEDIHIDGVDALAPYRVIVTCSHPEYWSTEMLDALEAWQRQGGRLMYLGGNGFYWRVAFSDAWPGSIELRRAEDGVRNWQTEPGENYHSFTGEYGGLWRRQGRAPNQLVGIGFAAQGFERATYFERSAEADDPRTSWIFDGVAGSGPGGTAAAGDRLGTSGLGGGAAGQEIDRYDTSLGSPDHAIVVASATDFGPDMVRTKEEFEASISVPDPDPLVRADVVFYETPGGGAVFSVGSISWFGALARDGYDNDIAIMTANVVRRFAEAEPFERPV